MSASLANPPRFRLSRRNGVHLEFESDSGFTAHLFVLQADIIRVAILASTGFSTTRTWAIAAGREDVPIDGIDRFDISQFSPTSFEVVEGNGSVVLATDRLRVTIKLAGFQCVWEMASSGGWQEIARDRPTQAYNFSWWGSKIYHYLARLPGERYYGLGERSGEMNRALRRFRLKNVDAMGYDARTSDPLYKHIPFHITLNGDHSAAFGVFYDTYADCEFDFGAEISNYHGPYRSFIAEGGDLDFYVIGGPRLAEVVRRFTWLTGRPMFPPRWALGYSGSTMSYTDAPDAQARMAEFIEKCRKHDILCDSFHLSSGYSSIGAQRHVFHWNRDKFPQPEVFVRSYHEAGLKLCANIKPCILADNPLFDEVRGSGLIICDESGEPAWTQFWDGIGVYLDFTNPAARRWWSEHVKSALLEFGIDSTWNDNNEFEIVSPDATAHGFDGPRSAIECKPLQSLLMMRSSRDAQREFSPDVRPFLVSRAGAAGMQRYAQTWSGDNYTSWETLKFNIRMGLGLALSGVSNSGHDVGGFAGPAPDPELFVRWVEAGVFMPRFSIHSWNSDGTVNEPWMHPEMTETVSALIKLRYALLPYLYDLLRRYHLDCEPVWRPTFYDFPDDPLCEAEADAYMLGSELLIAPVCAPNVRTLEVHLPAGSNWLDFWSGARFGGGQTLLVEAPLGQPPLFAREGSAIAMNAAQQHFDQRADERAFAVFPPENGRVAGSSYEDDGESEAWRGGAFGYWDLDVACADRLTVHCEKRGPLPPRSKSLAILFRPNETRAVTYPGGGILSDELVLGWSKVVIAVE